MSISTPYSARIRTVELLERAKAQTTSITIYRDNAVVIPSSASYTLKSSTGSKLVDSGSATIDGDSGVVTYTHSAEELPSSKTLGEGYLQEWSMTIDSVVHIFRRMTSLVLRRLYPVISDIDLTSVYSDLQELRPSTLSSYQKYIDDAWYQIIRKIRAKGNFEYLVMSSEALYEPHRHLSLYLIFRDFHSSLGQSNGRFLDLANEHQRMFQFELDNTNWYYDENHDNKVSDQDKRTAQQPVIYTTGAPFYKYNRFNRFGNY